jgi:hypothetical protein
VRTSCALQIALESQLYVDNMNGFSHEYIDLLQGDNFKACGPTSHERGTFNLISTEMNGAV